MKRLAALVVTVLLVVGAVVVRHRLDQPSTNDNGTGAASAASATLVCVTELAAVCQALAQRDTSLTVRVEDAATTQATLVADVPRGSGPAIDAWLAPRPLPEMVTEQRQRAGLAPSLDASSRVLARSPLVVAVWNDRRQVLAGRCPGGDITWRCVGEVAGTPWNGIGGQATWGDVKPGHPTPELTATGLLVIGQATGSYFGTSDYASNDFTDPAFRAWFERLERAVPTFPTPPRTPLDEMLFKGPSAFDLTGDLEADAAPAIVGSRDKDRLTILYPSPLATADLVLAPVAGSDAGGRLKKLLESNDAATALARAGWRVDGQPTADGIPADLALPADNGLPRAGVLQALRSLWIEVIR